MKKFYNLVSYEMKRIQYPYLILVGLILFGQIAAVFLTNREYIRAYELYMENGGESLQDFIGGNGPIQYFRVMNHPLFVSTIFLGIFAMLAYSFVIWYRDWIGKSSFSYRLLSLPGGRFSIFGSKMMLMFLLIMNLLVVQIVSVLIGALLLERIAPVDTFVKYTVLDLMQNSPTISFLVPPNILDFLVNYSLGFGFLFVVFMMILMELSYKWKGVLFDLVLGVLLVGAFLSVIRYDLFAFLLPMERMYLSITVGILTSIAASFISKYLLDHKVRM